MHNNGINVFVFIVYLLYIHKLRIEPIIHAYIIWLGGRMAQSGHQFRAVELALCTCANMFGGIRKFSI